MNSATATARCKQPVPYCTLGSFYLPVSVEDRQIAAEYPEIFSVDKPGRIVLPVADAQALGWWRFR